MENLKKGLFIGAIGLVPAFIVLIINSLKYLSEYPFYVSVLMMIGTYVVALSIFAIMFCVGEYMFKEGYSK